MFRAHVLIIRKSKLHYTTSGIITPNQMMHKICFTISFISCLYMFRAHVLIIRKSKLHYTTSGIITPNQHDAQNLFHSKFYFTPLHVSSTCAHHQEVKISLHSLWYHHSYRCDDTRGFAMQFWPPDDEHMCLKHVETSSHLQVWWYQRLCNAILTSWWWAHVLETCSGMK